MSDPAKLSDFQLIFGNIISIVTEIAIFAVFIMLLIGGFKYLTSGSDSKALDSAKGTLTNAVIGLVALIGVWLALRFIGVVTGVDVTTFRMIINP